MHVAIYYFEELDNVYDNVLHISTYYLRRLGADGQTDGTPGTHVVNPPLTTSTGNR